MAVQFGVAESLRARVEAAGKIVLTEQHVHVLAQCRPVYIALTIFAVAAGVMSKIVWACVGIAHAAIGLGRCFELTIVTTAAVEDFERGKAGNTSNSWRRATLGIAWIAGTTAIAAAAWFGLVVLALRY